MVASYYIYSTHSENNRTFSTVIWHCHKTHHNLHDLEKIMLSVLFPENYYLILYPIYIPNRNLTPPASFWFLCVIRCLMVLRYIDNNPAKGNIPSTWHIPLLHAQKTKIGLKRAFAAHDTATHHTASTASVYKHVIAPTTTTATFDIDKF